VLGGLAGGNGMEEFEGIAAEEAAEKVEIATAAPKGAVDFEGPTARLKPRPFKTRSRSEFFRSLGGRCPSHPSQRTRRMGHPRRSKCRGPSPSLRSGSG
jgi:hypothetical protein